MCCITKLRTTHVWCANECLRKIITFSGILNEKDTSVLTDWVQYNYSRFNKKCTLFCIAKKSRFDKKISVLLNPKIIDAGSTYSIERFYALTKWKPRMKTSWYMQKNYPFTKFRGFIPENVLHFLVSRICSSLKKYLFRGNGYDHGCMLWSGWGAVRTYAYLRQCSEPDEILVYRNYTEFRTHAYLW